MLLCLPQHFYLMSKKGQNREGRSAYKHTIKYLGVFGGAHGLSILLNMLRTKISSKLLGVAGISIIALSNRTVQMFSDATGLSLGFSAVRKISDIYETRDEPAVLRCVKVVRSIAFLTGIVGMFLMLVITPAICHWVFEESSTYYLPRMMMLSPVVFFMAISNGEIAILRGTRRLNKMAVYTLVTSVISIMVAVPLYYFVGVGGIFLGIFITALLQMLMLLAFTLPHYSYRVSPLSFSLLREGLGVVKLGAGFIFASAFNAFSMWLVCSLLSDAGDGETAGLFSAGFVMATLLPGMLFAALDSEYYPRLSGVASDIQACNAVVNEQIEVQLLVQSPMLIAFTVAMPVLVPLLYQGDFFPAVAMAQLAMLGMFMRTMTFPLSFLSLSKNDTLAYVAMEGVYNILFVILIVGGFLLWGFPGIGAGIAVLHTLDFAMVCMVARFRYRMRLSGKVVQYFLLQLPLFVAVIVVTRLLPIGWCYWLIGGVLALLSLVVTSYMFSRLVAIPDSVSRFSSRLLKKFRIKK